MARSARRSALSPMAFARAAALSKGVLGSHRGWRAFAVVYFGFRGLRRLFGRTPEVVTVEELAPGQRMHISAIPQAKRSRRRRDG